MSYEEWKSEQPVIARLLKEIRRLSVCYTNKKSLFHSEKNYLYALQDIQNWAMEETVPPADAPANWMDDVKNLIK